MPTGLAVTLRGMRFHTTVGILPHEGTLPQPLEVDVTAHVPNDGGGIVDYRAIHTAAATVAGRSGLQYLEDIAREIADAVLGEARVTEVRVAVRKPHVMLDGPLDYAEVVIERRRES